MAPSLSTILKTMKWSQTLSTLTVEESLISPSVKTTKNLQLSLKIPYWKYTAFLSSSVKGFFHIKLIVPSEEFPSVLITGSWQPAVKAILLTSTMPSMEDKPLEWSVVSAKNFWVGTQRETSLPILTNKNVASHQAGETNPLCVYFINDIKHYLYYLHGNTRAIRHQILIQITFWSCDGFLSYS